MTVEREVGKKQPKKAQLRCVCSWTSPNQAKLLI